MVLTEAEQKELAVTKAEKARLEKRVERAEQELGRQKSQHDQAIKATEAEFNAAKQAAVDAMNNQWTVAQAIAVRYGVKAKGGAIHDGGRYSPTFDYHADVHPDIIRELEDTFKMNWLDFYRATYVHRVNRHRDRQYSIVDLLAEAISDVVSASPEFKAAVEEDNRAAKAKESAMKTYWTTKEPVDKADRTARELRDQLTNTNAVIASMEARATAPFEPPKTETNLKYAQQVLKEFAEGKRKLELRPIEGA